MNSKSRTIKVEFDIGQWLNEKLEEVKLYVKDIRAMLNEEEIDDELLSEVYDSLYDVIEQIEDIQNGEDAIDYKKLLIICLESWLKCEGVCWIGDDEKDRVTDQEKAEVRKIVHKLDPDYPI